MRSLCLKNDEMLLFRQYCRTYSCNPYCFGLDVEQSMKQVLNSPPGMILSLVLLIVIFVFITLWLVFYI